MTTGMISKFNSLTELTNVVNSKTDNASSTDFSKVLKTNSSRQTDVAAGQTEKVEKNEAGEKKTDKADKSDDRTDADITKNNDEVKKDNVEQKDGATDDTDDTSEEIASDVMEAVASAVVAIAQILDVPQEAVTEAIEDLGLEDTDILDEASLKEIALEITDHEAVDLMTDEDLYNDIKAVTEAVDDIMSELEAKYDLPKEDIQNIASEVGAQQIDEPQIKVETSKEDAKSDTNTEDSNTQGQMNWTESIMDTIKGKVSEVSEPEATYSTDMEQIYDQVSQSIKLNLTDDVTEMEINLHPASLGNVKIQLAAKDGVITANFTTQNEQVKAALETQIIQLKENMNEQGIKVEAIEVAVAAHAFEENLSKEGERSSADAENETKRKRRNINLNEIDEIDDINSVEDEVRIAREMMMHNGTTVDYMA